METIGATPGKCSTLEKERGTCFDIDLNQMYPGEFQGPKYYHYNATNAVEARTKLKSIRKETADSYGKRDCKKVFREYVDLIRTCGQGTQRKQQRLVSDHAIAQHNLNISQVINWNIVRTPTVSVDVRSSL